MTTTAPPAAQPTMRLRSSCGLDLAPDAQRWFAAPDADDLFALDGLDDPVLDVGCGPGRIVTHLAATGIACLGVDVNAAALRRAQDLGAPVLLRSVFDPLPGTGRWGAVVLLDGNIGIGGDPSALLARCHDLLRPGGQVVAEVEAPGVASRRIDAQISVDDAATEWFPWSIVGADDIAGAGTDAGLRALSVRRSNERWFATLQRV